MKRLWMMIVIFFSPIAFSGTMGTIPEDCRLFGTASFGPVWARAGETQTFFLAPEIEKTYLARKSTNILPEGEIFLGAQKNYLENLIGRLGIAVAVTGNARLQGIILDDATPEFDNYLYDYKVQHTRVAAKGKLLLDKNYWVIPWISASLGVAFNHAHDFTNTPVIFEAIPNNNFASNTKTAFTYSVGAGFQKAIDRNWQLGVGYEFVDWGKSELNRAAGQTLNSGLKLNHLYTNGILFNITYIV